jgi:hypothetical protein
VFRQLRGWETLAGTAKERDDGGDGKKSNPFHVRRTVANRAALPSLDCIATEVPCPFLRIPEWIQLHRKKIELHQAFCVARMLEKARLLLDNGGFS